MKKLFEKAKKPIQKMFWDTCFIESFTETETEWGETLHRKGKGISFPCRITEKAVACKQNGLLSEIEKTVILLYPTEEEIKPGSSVCVQKENGEIRQYIAAGESQLFLTHKAVALKRREMV